MSTSRSYRVDVAVAAVAAARARSSVADLAQRQVTAAAIAVMRGEGLSDRGIAAELRISKSSIRALSLEPTIDEVHRGEVDRLTRAVWVDTADLAGDRFVVDGDDIPSYERMAAHGIEPAYPGSVGRADTLSREYLQVTTGERIVVFSQSRWNGFPDQTAELGWNHRGGYLVHHCPGLTSDGCTGPHRVVSPTDLGLSDGAEMYGSGWDGRKPTAHQVWKLLTAAIEERYEVFDPSYPEFELGRRPGTTPRYAPQTARGSQRSDARRQTNP